MIALTVTQADDNYNQSKRLDPVVTDLYIVTCLTCDNGTSIYAALRL